MSRKSAVSGMSHLQYEEKILKHEESVQCKKGTSVVERQGKRKGNISSRKTMCVV